MKTPLKPCPLQRGANISKKSCDKTQAYNLCKRQCEQPDVKPVEQRGIPGNLFDFEGRN
jgi:hypothetical protein